MSESLTVGKRRLAAILMADVAGFSRLMGRDEEGTTSRIREFHRRVERLVREHEGRVVDTAGDSVFGEFASVVKAVECARAIQESPPAGDPSTAEPILTRIGLHLGDVIAEGDRLYGDGVNIAARLEQLAEPGGICVSEAVYQQVRNKIAARFEDAGEQRLKNIEHPVRLFTLPPRALVTTRGEPIQVRGLRQRGAAAAVRDASASGFLIEDVLRPGTFVPVVLALLLLVSPFASLPSAGVLPAAGGLLLCGILGGLWGRRSGRRGGWGVGIGCGLVLAALLTNWSVETNGLLVAAGALTAAGGLSRAFRR